MLKKFLTTLTLLLSSMALLFAQEDKVFALVLSGGGARGLAHIPIIEELERRGIVPDIVIGTSMGGLVGGLYAAGYNSSDLYRAVEDMDIQSAVFSFTQPVDTILPKALDNIGKDNFSLDFSENGVGNSDSVLDDWAINRLIHSSICRVEYLDSFDELSIPYRTVGTDYSTGEGIIFDSGSLYEAMRGTMSMPVFFPALVLEDGTYVVDGGVYNNLPTDLARELGADIILAVDVNESVAESAADNGDLDTVTGSFNHYLTIVGQIRSRELFQDADYLLIPELSGFWVADFASQDEIIQAGRDCVEANQAIFDALEAELGGRDVAFESYFDKEPMTVEGFVFDENLERFSDEFEPFIGRPYNEETVAGIDRLLSQLRRMTNKLTLSYRMKDDGCIHVISRDYNTTTSSIRLGLAGGVHSFTHIVEPKFHLVLDPDFHVSFDTWVSDIRLSASLVMGQQNTVSLTSFFLLGQNWGIETGAKGAFGGFSSISDRVYEHRYVTRDWNFGAWLDISFLSGISHRLDFELGYDFYSLGGMQGNEYKNRPAISLWTKERHHYPYLGLRYNFDGTHLESDHETGFSFETFLKVGWDGDWVYRLEGELDASILLTPSHSSFLDLSLSLFSARAPHELLDSWRIDSFGQLSADNIYLDAAYRYYFFPHRNGLYASGGLFAEFLSRDDIPSARSDMIPFGGLNGMEFGLVGALGYVSDFGDVVAICHLSLTGRLSLSIEVR